MKTYFYLVPVLLFLGNFSFAKTTGSKSNRCVGSQPLEVEESSLYKIKLSFPGGDLNPSLNFEGDIDLYEEVVTKTFKCRPGPRGKGPGNKSVGGKTPVGRWVQVNTDKVITGRKIAFYFDLEISKIPEYPQADNAEILITYDTERDRLKMRSNTGYLVGGHFKIIDQQ